MRTVRGARATPRRDPTASEKLTRQSHTAHETATPDRTGHGPAETSAPVQPPREPQNLYYYYKRGARHTRPLVSHSGHGDDPRAASLSRWSRLARQHACTHIKSCRPGAKHPEASRVPSVEVELDAKVSHVAQQVGCEEGPGVHGEADPLGEDLDPEREDGHAVRPRMLVDRLRAPVGK